jgi:hypothetical protein
MLCPNNILLATIVYQASVRILESLRVNMGKYPYPYLWPDPYPLVLPLVYRSGVDVPAHIFAMYDKYQ